MKAIMKSGQTFDVRFLKISLSDFLLRITRSKPGVPNSEINIRGKWYKSEVFLKEENGNKAPVFKCTQEILDALGVSTSSSARTLIRLDSDAIIEYNHYYNENIEHLRKFANSVVFSEIKISYDRIMEEWYIADWDNELSADYAKFNDTASSILDQFLLAKKKEKGLVYCYLQEDNSEDWQSDYYYSPSYVVPKKDLERLIMIAEGKETLDKEKEEAICNAANLIDIDKVIRETCKKYSTQIARHAEYAIVYELMDKGISAFPYGNAIQIGYRHCENEHSKVIDSEKFTIEYIAYWMYSSIKIIVKVTENQFKCV